MKQELQSPGFETEIARSTFLRDDNHPGCG